MEFIMRRKRFRTRVALMLYDRQISGQWFARWKKSYLEVKKILNGEKK